MSWGFEFVCDTQDEAFSALERQARVRDGIPRVIVDVIQSMIVSTVGFGEGISMIVESHGSLKPGQPCNCTFSIRPMNNASNGVFKP